jgi:formate dehydrogenase subunit gamma
VETFEPWSAARAEEIIAPYLTREGALLPILHALQDAFGCVPREAVALVAHALNLSRAEAHGVVTFYHDFTESPRGRRVIKLCRAESCQAMGGEDVARQLLAALGMPADEPWGGTTSDGSVTVEPVYCLGLCSVSPAALVDGEPRGRVDGMALAKAARAERSGA